MLLGVDIGGTFTDFVLLRDGEIEIHKVLTTPQDRSLAFMEGLRALGAEREGTIVHGSTVATNALLERTGARTVLVATAGFADVIEIGRQNRSELYRLIPSRPEPLVERGLRVEVQERIDHHGHPLSSLSEEEAERVVSIVAGLRPESVAICLLFSFLNDDHERLVADAITRRLNDSGVHCSRSSEVLPEYREYERTSTTVINAYVSPAVSDYLDGIQSRLGRPFRVMQSSGGIASASSLARQGVRTILSGPAGGVSGAFFVASTAGYDQVISFDMGGTSTDVSLCPGFIQHTYEAEIAGLPVRVPTVDVHTVGAGGGSIARIDAGGALTVGPESAGARPGPACYGTGSAVTVTDANLALGRLDPYHFLGGRMTLNTERTNEALGRLAEAMGGTPLEAAWGVIRVANANMEAAIRRISVERGFDPRDFTLAAFGGAGPLHACELAEELQIPRVLVPLYPGVLSAYGLLSADVVKEYSRTVLASACEEARADLEGWFAPLVERGVQDLEIEGFPPEAIQVEKLVDVRYAGQSFELTVPFSAAHGVTDSARSFHALHERRFGHANPNAPVEIVNIRVRARGSAEKPRLAAEPLGPADPGQATAGHKRVFFGEFRDAVLYERGLLLPGNRVQGPGIVFQFDTTTVIPPEWNAIVDPCRNLLLTRTFA